MGVHIQRDDFLLLDRDPSADDMMYTGQFAINKANLNSITLFYALEIDGKKTWIPITNSAGDDLFDNWRIGIIPEGFEYSATSKKPTLWTNPYNGYILFEQDDNDLIRFTVKEKDNFRETGQDRATIVIDSSSLIARLQTIENSLGDLITPMTENEIMGYFRDVFGEYRRGE